MKLSQVYDEILADVESTRILANKLDKDLQEPILECACGSGDLLSILQKKYLAFGIDIDQEMLTLAKEKGCRNLILKDMTQIDFFNSFKTILCLGDSINYLTIEQVDLFFQNVKNALTEEGIFIFDTHHIERLSEFQNPFIEEVDMNDYQYQWTIQTIDDQLFHQFVFYIEDDTIIERIVQTVFTEKEIEQRCKTNGLIIIKKEIDDDKEKVMYWCKKEAI